MGTTAPARAVAEGTKKAKMMAIAMAPITMWEVFSPAIFSTYSAIRLCRPVACIAPAKISAAATSATADEENPAIATLRALEVP